MNETQKVQYLIVDTSAFIRNAPLQDIGVNIITEQDVVNEVTSKRQLRRLVVLPYDLKIQNAYPENIKFVTEFAKKTGDYSSLSATDVKVIALTYQLEKEKIGIDHLRTEPKITQTVDSNVKKAEDLRTPLAGFYMPKKKEDIDEENIKECDDEGPKQEKYSENNYKKKIAINLRNRVTNMDFKETEEESESDYRESYSVSGSDYETAESEIDQNRTEDLSTKFSRLTCESTNFIVQDKDDIEHNVDDILIPIKENNDNTDKYNEYKNNRNDDNNDNYEDENDDGDDGDDGDDDDDDDDDDGSGWITSENISRIKKELDSDFLEQKSVTVACLTMDFAMQNVLKQIGLNMVALDGRIIKQMRTYIFRCHACYKTTSIMTKVFCPNCGNKTLKKVAVTINQEGKQEIHINFRRPLSKKGKKFSLPLPKGGKHANNPILCEDQPLPDQRPSRLARTKNNPLEDDHIAEYSPFVMRDIHSKSAMLGIRTKGPAKYWMQRNPNEVRKRK